MDVIRDGVLYVNTSDSGTGLGIVVERMVESSPNSENLFGRVDVVTEIEIIDLIDVTLIHVGFEQSIQN